MLEVDKYSGERKTDYQDRECRGGPGKWSLCYMDSQEKVTKRCHLGRIHRTLKEAKGQAIQMPVECLEP